MGHSIFIFWGAIAFIVTSLFLLHAPVLAANCIDSDGMDMNVAGTTNDSSGDYADYCLDETQVVEYYCVLSDVTSKNLDCSLYMGLTPGKCSNGRCVAAGICYDSDENNNLDNFEKGTCQIPNGTLFTDYCVSGDHLVEYVCHTITNASCLTAGISCSSNYGIDYWCQDGKCVSPASFHCYDSDGNNTENAGYVNSTANGYYDDSCFDTTTVIEHYCSANLSANFTEDCTILGAGFECSDGRCLNVGSYNQTCLCSSCSECTQKLNSSLCGGVKLSNDIYVTQGYGDPSCITADNIDHKTLDCDDHMIHGKANVSGDRLIEAAVSIFQSDNITVKNCVFKGYNGVNGVNGTYGGFNHGLFLQQVQNSNIYGNYFKDVHNMGLYLHTSTHNNITHNYATNNAIGFYISDSADYNRLYYNKGDNNSIGFDFRGDYNDLSYSIGCDNAINALVMDVSCTAGAAIGNYGTNNKFNYVEYCNEQQLMIEHILCSGYTVDCVDTDGGNFPFVRGSVSNGTDLLVDYCWQGVLREHYCSGPDILYEETNCSSIGAYCDYGSCHYPAGQGSSESETIMGVTDNVAENFVFEETDITITPNTTINDYVNVVVTRNDIKPSGTANLPPVSDVLEYLDIGVSDNLKNNFKTAIIKFNVSKNWLNSRGLGRSEVKIYRHNNVLGKWDLMPYVESGEDADAYYYDVTTTQFSIWFIGGGSVTGMQSAPGFEISWIMIIISLIVAISAIIISRSKAGF